jgi:NADH-quinone oxidoreductase subunit C
MPEDRRREAPAAPVAPEPGSIADTFAALLPGVALNPIQGARDVLLNVSREDAHKVLEVAKTSDKLQMDFLRDLCGVDYEAEGLEVVYQLYRYSLRHSVTVKARVPVEDPRIASAVDLWNAADWHERECRDMFGIVFEGHPNLVPILLPEDMLDHYPLRKDNPLAPLEEWQGTMLGDNMGSAGHIPPGSGIEVSASAESE